MQSFCMRPFLCFRPGFPMDFRIAAAAAAVTVTLLFLPLSYAHEGHDHGDAPPVVVSQSVPRTEAQSALFELVAIASGGSIEIYLDRFETNEPVTDAVIEVETPAGPLSAVAEAEIYRIEAPWSLQPGEYDLIFTVSSGADIDFLTATLSVPDVAAPVLAQRSGWLANSAFADEMQEVLATDLRDRLSRNDPGLIAVGILGFLGGLLVMAVFRRRTVFAAGTGAVLFVIFAGSIAVAHEGHDHGDQAALMPVPSGRDMAQRLPDGSIFVPKPSQRILAIRTVLTAQEAHRRSVEMPGRIIPDPNASGYVQAAIAGRLSPPAGGFPRLGARVEAGDVLAEITPPLQMIDQSDVRQRQSELAQEITIAEQRIRRFETLVASGAVARTTLDEAKIELEGLKERRSALEQVQVQPEPLVAPVAGIIAASNAVAGQMAESNAVIFHIVDPARLWVEALSYGNDGQFDTAAASDGSNRALALKFEGAGFADRSQAVPVHFSIESDTKGLRLGQMLSVLGQTQETEEGLAIPRMSVLRGANGQDMVFLHVGAERFEPREVRIMPLDGDRVLVAAGVEPGARVVTQGAELLNQIR